MLRDVSIFVNRRNVSSPSRTSRLFVQPSPTSSRGTLPSTKSPPSAQSSLCSTATAPTASFIFSIPSILSTRTRVPSSSYRSISWISSTSSNRSCSLQRSNSLVKLRLLHPAARDVQRPLGNSELSAAGASSAGFDLPSVVQSNRHNSAALRSSGSIICSFLPTQMLWLAFNSSETSARLIIIINHLFDPKGTSQKK